jgi:hypothetical protein
MSMKTLKRTLLGVALLGGIAAMAPAQIPLPPLPPGLNVRITTGRPPAVRREVRVARPGPDYIYVNGYWHDDGGRWAWIPGRWERPAAPQAYWIPARYINSGRGTIYEPAHWSNQQVVVEDDVARRREWRQHERMHQRELERERNRDNYRDRYDDHNPR